MTLDNFKGPTKTHRIMVESYKDGEVYEAIPEKAIADIASSDFITNEQALDLLVRMYNEDSFVDCQHKDCQFWIEEIS